MFGFGFSQVRHPAPAARSRRSPGSTAGTGRPPCEARAVRASIGGPPGPQRIAAHSGTTAPCKQAIARRRPPASPCFFGYGNGIEENFRYITVANDEGFEFPFQGEIIARISAKSRISGVGREASDAKSQGSVIYREKLRIHYRSSTSYPILQGRMPASRALSEPREPLTTALGARAVRRRGARRSGLQKTAGSAISPDRERGIPWNAEHPRRCPEASQAHGQARGLLRQTGTAIPWGHACSARETALRRTTGAQPTGIERGRRPWQLSRKRSDRYEHH